MRQIGVWAWPTANEGKTKGESRMGLDREKVLREGLAGRVGRELAKSATTMDVRRHGHVVRARANCEAFSSAPFSLLRVCLQSLRD